MKKYWIGLGLLLSACSTTTTTVKEKDVFIKAPYLHAEQRIEGSDAITPEVYAIAATRVTNKMLDQTRNIYENNGETFLYIMEPKKMDRSLPDGFYYAQKLTKDIITGSQTFKPVNNMNEADYYLEVLVDKSGNEEVPVVIYKMILFDHENVKIDEWSESVKRIRNDDRSWW